MTISRTYNQIPSSYYIKRTLIQFFIHSRALTSDFETFLENFKKGTLKNPTLALQLALLTANTFSSRIRPLLPHIASSASFQQQEQVSLVLSDLQNLLYSIKLPHKTPLASFAIFLFNIKIFIFSSTSSFL